VHIIKLEIDHVLHGSSRRTKLTRASGLRGGHPCVQEADQDHQGEHALQHHWTVPICA
jgi:hypothetical protein